MPASVVESPVLTEVSVARPPKKADKSEASLRQVNIRLDPAYAADLEATAHTLGLDLAQFLRMIVRENYPAYRVRAEKVRKDTPDPGKS